MTRIWGMGLAVALVCACGDDGGGGADDAGGSAADANNATDSAVIDGAGAVDGSIADGAPGDASWGSTSSPNHLWSFAFGGAGAGDQVFARDVAVDSSGNTYVFGVFSGTVDFSGAGETRTSNGFAAFVAKYNSAGAYVAVSTFAATGSGSTITANAIAIDSAANVVIGGSFIGSVNFGGRILTSAGSQFVDVYIARFDSSLSHLASDEFGVGTGTTDTVADIAIGPSNNIHVIGRYQTSIDFGGVALTTSAGDYNVFVVKLDGDLALVHQANIGTSTSEQIAQRIAVSSAGTIAVGVETEGDIDFGDGVISNPAGRRAAVGVYTSTLSLSHKRLFTGAQPNSIWGLGYSATRLFVAGRCNGDIDLGGGVLDATGAGNDDLYVGEFDAANAYVSGQVHGFTGSEGATDLSVTSSGLPVVVGQMTSDMDFRTLALTADSPGFNGFIVQLNEARNAYWGLSFSDTAGSGFTEATAVAVAGNDDVIVIGTVNGTVDLGGGPVSMGAQNEFFIARYGAPQ